MIKEKNEIRRTIKVWQTVSKVVSTIHTERQYKRTVRMLDQLIDEVSDKSDPVKESLIDTLGTLVKDYEDRKIEEPAGDPIGVLKFLLEEHGLKQSDLSEIGSQGVVSEIINGKRKLNLRQVVILSKMFSVSPSVFIENK
ncbi:MAG: helix-turn-helix domain-containing protein [Ignavibacteriae bacterium]|nr:helix-turn-helix domain-containing protein [Ignavibacteriota bacterium]NOG96873.1 helix-turn-helix domain-containing protein [Ignavibacteriota bacterium]